MGNRMYLTAVVLLWLTSMGWLVTNKILPSLNSGQPPIASGLEPGKVVAWRVLWSDQHVGWAASLRTRGDLNTTELHNRVILRDVPLLDLAPVWMRSIVDDIGKLTFDTKTLIEFDPLDHFSSFNSRVGVNDIPSVLRISGRMEDSQLLLRVWSGQSEMTYTTRVYIPHQAALGEALFPDASMPYMYVGRRWQEEVFNPFRTPSSPVELVDVEVTGKEILPYGEKDEIRSVFRVEYRGLSGPGVQEETQRHAVCWVEPASGNVLRQDIYLANTKLRFERVPEAEAYRIGLDFFPNEEMLEFQPEAESTSEKVPAEKL